MCVCVYVRINYTNCKASIPNDADNDSMTFALTCPILWLML